jgi:hypothetical protein
MLAAFAGYDHRQFSRGQCRVKNRWISVCLPLWLLCCLSCGAIATEDRAAGDNRPNVLLILSDDQAWTDYGFMGHPTIRTDRKSVV